MKRSKLKRKTPLRNLAGFDQKPYATPLKRAPLARGNALQRRPPKRRARVPSSTAGEVARNSRKRCVRCKERGGLQRHHVLPVRLFPQYELEPLCMVLVCAGCHDEHERAHRRLRMSELPVAVLAWATSRGEREAVFMARTYPVR